MLGPQIRLWMYKILRRYRNMGDCIFCKLANGEISTEMVYEDDKIAVFRDAAPQAPVHMLMVPKAHIASLDDLSVENAELMGHMMLKIKEVAAQEGLDNGYRGADGRSSRQTGRHGMFRRSNKARGLFSQTVFRRRQNERSDQDSRRGICPRTRA